MSSHQAQSLLIDTDIEADLEVREFCNRFLTCLPTRRGLRRLVTRSRGRLSLGVAMEGSSYQLDYVRAVNSKQHHNNNNHIKTLDTVLPQIRLLCSTAVQ